MTLLISCAGPGEVPLPTARAWVSASHGFHQLWRSILCSWAASPTPRTQISPRCGRVAELFLRQPPWRGRRLQWPWGPALLRRSFGQTSCCWVLVSTSFRDVGSGLPLFLSPMLLDLVPGWTRSSNKVGPIQLATDLWWSQGCNRSSHQSEAWPVRVGTLAEAKAKLVEAISCCDSLEAFRSFGGRETGGKLDSSCTICWACLDFYASEGEPDGRGTSGNSWLPSWIASLNGSKN